MSRLRVRTGPAARTPRRLRPWRAVRAITALALLVTPTAGATAPLYQWSDASGAVRYTSHGERIPRAAREHAHPVEPGRSAAQNAALLPGARAAPGPEAEAEGSAATGSVPAVGAPAEDPAGSENTTLAARIAELEAAVARDEALLEELVSDPEAAAQLRESEALAAIAERLPRLQRALRELRARRDARAGGDGS